jgi:hypothetical protein
MRTENFKGDIIMHQKYILKNKTCQIIIYWIMVHFTEIHFAEIHFTKGVLPKGCFADKTFR